VLVIGTTADYIELLNQRFPDRIIFVTDKEVRFKWKGTPPDKKHEILTEFDDYNNVLNSINNHLQIYRMQSSGIVCFDCESLQLAAQLAQYYQLPFPSEAAVLVCRSKYHSKQIWMNNKISCPQAALVNCENDTIKFFDSVKEPVVLKPLTGSGSELVFLCETAESCRESYRVLCDKLKCHPNRRMYGKEICIDNYTSNSLIEIETYIDGDEFSCDFMLDKGRVGILRISKKVPLKDSIFGTTLAYQLLYGFEDFSEVDFLDLLKKAAMCLGLERTLGMADFKINQGKVYFLEITPRLGGDCLPWLIQEGCNFDVFQAALDFAQTKPINVSSKDAWQPLVGLKLFSSKAGIIKKLNVSALCNDKRIIKYFLKKQAGDNIQLLPYDYDSHVLGHVIFKPSVGRNLEEECLEISNKVFIYMK